MIFALVASWWCSYDLWSQNLRRGRNAKHVNTGVFEYTENEYAHVMTPEDKTRTSYELTDVPLHLAIIIHPDRAIFRAQHKNFSSAGRPKKEKKPHGWKHDIPVDK